MWEYLIIFLEALLVEKMLQDLTLVITELYSPRTALFLPCTFLSFYAIYYILKFQEEEFNFSL